MLVITVARKPVSEGTVVKNALVYGTGGLNIDACRIGTDGRTCRDGKATMPNAAGWQNMKGHGIATLNSGRWPANLILSHLPECQQVGSQASKGRQLAAGSTGFGVGRDDQYKAGTGRQYAEGGTVPVWHCSEGCPVKDLDAQSGFLHPAGNLGGTPRTAQGYSDGWPKTLMPASKDGDKGGASRYYKQIHGDTQSNV